MAVALDRGEGTGLGLALLGHLVLFGLLTVGFLATPNPAKLEPTPIEISLTDEAGLKSEAPVINREAPAERLAEVPAPTEPVTPPPVAQPEPEPVVRPDPAPPKPEPRPAPRKPEPPKKAEPKKASAPAPKATPQPTRREVRPTGRLTGIVNGLTDQPSKGKATTPQASQIGPAVKSSLAAEVIRQLRPHWRSPTGADVELLRTTVEIRLNRDGTLAAPPRVINQTGVNASNRAQADLHKERALNAARLAAPFNLPAEYYDAWKILRPNFDRNLSR
ncbi:cell envelope biogenesis protein TolA [Sphingomonas koreensis]|uniref:cell envelope biogenesis protein TolA n=1 Tax=Sphingomonas koreensis TaxID=93064 RepID=UPI000F7E26C0|nr:cell envelope biogenesis protein TolA [Sphingomonas koreensis]RSX07727.1 cell envelope biogenesis protein TolA [Sphingomonas koreensis]